MYNTHRLIEHIASFTSHRDMELLAFSLLKSINSILKPLDIKILKMDSKNRPLQEIVFQREACTVCYDDITVKEELEMAIDYIHTTKSDHYIANSGDTVVTTFLLEDNRASASFMVMRSNARLAKVDLFLIVGMLDIYRNFSRLLIDSQTDELTGLANRKTFEAAISRVYEILLPEDDYPDDLRQQKVDENNLVYWLVLIDIDHFKKINDNYGHVFGDEVLVLISQVMKYCLREDDLLFRFGGEEFVVILKSPDEEACMVALERLRTQIAETDFPGVGTVTVSMGGARVDRDVFHVTLLDYADQALYYSKNNGRNKITFFDELVAMGEANVGSTMSGEISLF